jgi:hypothetical protein
VRGGLEEFVWFFRGELEEGKNGTAATHPARDLAPHQIPHIRGAAMRLPVLLEPSTVNLFPSFFFLHSSTEKLRPVYGRIFF